MPDYDGLPETGDDVGDAFLWTARILTGPLYLLTEFVIRRPLGWAITELEQGDLIQKTIEFFTFGPNDNIAVFPTAFYEFGYQPNIGIYASWREFLFRENNIQTHAGFGGPDWLSWTIADEITVNNVWQLGTMFFARKRPDFVFGGIGPLAGSRVRARFGAERVETQLWSNVNFWQSSDLHIAAAYRNIGFIDQGWNDELSVGERAQETGTPVPFGFNTGYEAVSGEVRADLDTRPHAGPPTGGVQVQAYAGQHGAWGAFPRLERWVGWGGNATLATDILGRHRVLGLTVDTRFISPIDHSNVPFTELIDVGGTNGLLPGYWPGHIRAFSAAGATLHYTWPIWAFLDARLFFGAANAFDEYLRDFDFGLLRMSFGLVFFPRVDGTEMPFRLEIAFATDTFDRGSSLTSFRFAIGTIGLDIL